MNKVILFDKLFLRRQQPAGIVLRTGYPGSGMSLAHVVGSLAAQFASTKMEVVLAEKTFAISAPEIQSWNDHPVTLRDPPQTMKNTGGRNYVSPFKKR